MTNKSLTIGLVVTFVIAIFGIFSPVGQSAINSLGTAAANCASGVTCFTNLGATGTFEVDGAATFNSTVTNSAAVTNTSTFKLGSNGTTLTQIIKGTCNPLGMDVAQAASTTVGYDCAVTGVVSGDVVVANFASSSPTSGLGSLNDFQIKGVQASSTSGFITLKVANLTGISRTPSATNFASGTEYMIMR